VVCGNIYKDVGGRIWTGLLPKDSEELGKRSDNLVPHVGALGTSSVGRNKRGRRTSAAAYLNTGVD
jgi:hypothetical protein